MAPDRWDPLLKLKSVLPDLLDSATGLIGYLAEHPRDPGSPEFFRFISKAGDTRAFGEHQNFSVGGGAATRREVALAKTVGEALERYAAAIYRKDDFPFCSYRDADFACVDPRAFQLFSDWQYEHPAFQFRRADHDSLVRWVQAYDLTEERYVHVPAGVIYVPYVCYRRLPEIPLTQPISTGLACHMTLEEAAIGGICEVIERDCFSITWQAMVSRRRIRLDSLDPENADLVRRFADVGYELTLADISNETGIPCVLSVIRGQHPRAVPIATAASVELDPRVAVRKSLEELAHTERYFAQIKRELKRIEPEPGYLNISSQVSHVNFWCNPAVTHHADFLGANPESVPLDALPNFATGDPKRDLRQLVRKISASGHRVLLCELTTPDLRSLGFHVVRALIPGYHPLHMGFINRATGGTRLWEIPQRLGFPGIRRETGDNPLPHPFP